MKKFYTLVGSKNGGAMLARGFYDKLSDAKHFAKEYDSAVIYRHLEKNGVRISSEAVFRFGDQSA